MATRAPVLYYGQWLALVLIVAGVLLAPSHTVVVRAGIAITGVLLLIIGLGVVLTNAVPRIVEYISGLERPPVLS